MTYTDASGDAAGDKAAWIEAALDDNEAAAENDNAHLSAGDAFSNTTPGGAQRRKAEYSAELLEKAREIALMAAVFDPPSSSPDMRAVAVWLAERGLHPTPLDGKRPIVRQFNIRTTNDPDKVFKTFSEAPQPGEPWDCNVGIVNGRPLDDEYEPSI